jgi:hypothetical protein
MDKILNPCKICGCERWQTPYNAKKSPICFNCAAKKRSKEYPMPINWKGGKAKCTKGYIMVKLQSSDFYAPMTNKQRYVMEHRLVMAKSLGRCLTNEEVVHHKNGNVIDNRLENLEILNNSQHSHIPKTKVRKDKLSIAERHRRILEYSRKFYAEHKELCKQRTEASRKKRIASSISSSDSTS